MDYRNISISERLALIGELLAKGVYLHSQKKAQGTFKQPSKKAEAASPETNTEIGAIGDPAQIFIDRKHLSK